MKHLSIIFLSFFLLLCGCADQSDQYSVDIPASGDTPLSVSSVSLSGSIETKAIQKSGSIGVFRTTAGGYTALNNVKYTYSSDWIPASPIYLNSTAASVCGYYPYGAAGITNSSNPSSVTLTSQKYSEGEDLCYSTLVSTPTSSTPDVSFSMVRAYSMLTINITRENTYTGNGAISNISIVNPGAKTSNTLNITTGVYGSGTFGTVSYNPGISSIASGSSATTRVLMVPTTMTGYMYLRFTVDGTVRSAFLPVASKGLSTLAAGGNYTINIAIGRNGEPESNCYIVAPGGTIYIPVSRANTANPAGFSIADAFTTGLLWSEISATHVIPTVSDRYIKVVASASSGNSVIYAKDTNGNIVWSWHIWVTDYNPDATARSFNGNLWMDRNIGATTSTVDVATSRGLYYQWGRKDPFPASLQVKTLSEPTLYGEKTAVAKTAVAASPNFTNSIKNPLTFYFNNVDNYDWYTVGTGTQNDALWYDGTPNKTVYDPCPVGWRVPYYKDNTSPWNGLTLENQTWVGGFNWTGSPNLGYYPGYGWRKEDSGTFNSITQGFYWAATSSETKAYCFSIGTVYVSGWGNMPIFYPSASQKRALGFSVRCVKI